MALPAKQIGWSNEANLLYEVLKRLEQLITVTAAGNVYTTTTTTTAH